MRSWQSIPETPGDLAVQRSVQYNLNRVAGLRVQEIFHTLGYEPQNAVISENPHLKSSASKISRKASRERGHSDIERDRA